MLVTVIDYEGSVSYENAIVTMDDYQKELEDFQALVVSVHANEEKYGISIAMEDRTGLESRVSFLSENPTNDEPISDGDMAMLNSISGYIIDELEVYDNETISCLVPDEDYETTGLFKEIPEINPSGDRILSVTVCKRKENDNINGYYLMFGKHTEEDNDIMVMKIDV